MTKIASSFAASACFIALLGTATPAGALDFVSFVSGTGADTGTCGTPTAACRQVTYALGQTNEGGIIHVLPGEYDAFAPNKTIEIVADAGQASIFTTTIGDAGIAVTVSGASVVRLRGFLVSAAHGIAISGGGGVVHIEDCTLLGAETKHGIVYAPTGASELYVSDTAINGPGVPNAGGILIKPTGSGSAKVVLDNVAVSDNTGGILIDGNATTGTNTVTVRNSVSSGSSFAGLVAQDSGNGVTNVMIEGSTFSNNAGAGVRSAGASAIIRMRNSTVSGNVNGIVKQTGGQIISNGGNVVRGNGANGTFSTTEAQQ